MHKSAVILFFVAILLGGIILLVGLVDEPPKLESESTPELTEDEETKLTPEQQLKEKIKEVATKIKQRHKTKILMLSIHGVRF